MATIYFNLYLSAVSNDQKTKAMDYNLKSMEYNQLLHGANSLQVSNNHYIHSQLLLKTSKLEEAKVEMLKALEFFNEPVEEEKDKNETLLNKVRYYSAMANIVYVQ